MSYQNRRSQQRFLVFIGVLMIASMVFSLLVPLLQNTQQAALTAPTATPAPTLVPTPNSAAITFDQTYLHPSGLYTVGVPTGWSPADSTTVSTEAQLTLQNNDIGSVIEVRLMKPSAEQGIASVNDLEKLFTADWLQQTWRRYASWEESTRRVEGDRLVIDFSASQRNVDYIARQIAFLQGTEVIVVRVVTPPNMPDTVRFLLDGVAQSIKPVPQFLNSDFNQNSYFDPLNRHIIRFSKNWSVVDSASGQPASITATNVALVVEAVDGTVSDEEAARTWVQNSRAGVEVFSVKPVTRDSYSGYQVSFKITTLDGDAQSGAAILLNGSDNKVHVATLRLTDVPNVDLNSEVGAAAQPEALSALNSFTILPDLTVADFTVTPTAPAQ